MKASTGHTTRISTQTDSEPVWAIRVGNFVELRSGKALTKHVGKLSKEAVVSDYFWARPERKKVEVRIVGFTGGVLLGYIKLSKFVRRFKFTPPKGDALKLSRAHAKIVNNAAWQRRNL